MKPSDVVLVPLETQTVSNGSIAIRDHSELVSLISRALTDYLGDNRSYFHDSHEESVCSITA